MSALATAAPGPLNRRLAARLAAASYLHSLVFTGLLAVWLAPGMEAATAVLGWSHGLLWIGLSLVVAEACRRRLLPWSQLVLVSVVGVFLGPFAGSWGFKRVLQAQV